MSWELNRIKEIPLFSDCMKKLTISSTELSSKEKTFILTVAALLIKKYSLDKRHVGYAELAYYIVLNYSLIFNDYLPLYDFSISFGIYPISYALTKNGFLSFESLEASNFLILACNLARFFLVGLRGPFDKPTTKQ